MILPTHSRAQLFNRSQEIYEIIEENSKQLADIKKVRNPIDYTKTQHHIFGATMKDKPTEKANINVICKIQHL